MKKGFTLIEIIIAIVLIVSISSIGVVAVFKNKTTPINKDYQDILNAAKLYANNEVDNEGNTFISQILEGANGVQIPLQSLVSSGYISDAAAQEVYDDNGNPNAGSDYYIILLSGQIQYDPNQPNYCEEGEITILLSWTTSNMEPVYLCNNYKEKPSEISDIEYLNQNIRMKYSSDKFAVLKTFKDNLIANGITATSFVDDENGLFNFAHEVKAGNYLYTYYRGAVDNNYVKLGTKDGADLIWRIVWLRDDNKMKLVLDKTVPLSITLSNDETISVKGKKIYNFSPFYFIDDALNRVVTDSRRTTSNDYTYYDLFLPENKYILSSSSVNFIHNYNLTNSNNFYKDASSTYDNFEYYPSSNFDCAKGKSSSSVIPTYDTVPSYYSSKVGFLTYGDLEQTGILKSVSQDLLSSGHYLINDNSSYAIQDLSNYQLRNSVSNGCPGYLNEKSIAFFVDNFGIRSQEFYYRYRKNSYKSGGCYGDYVYYNIYDADGKLLIEDFINHGDSGDIITEFTFHADSIKPAIIIDLSNYKLSNNTGKSGDEYTIVAK